MAMSKAQRQEVRLLKRRSERWNKRRVFVEGVKCIQELCKATGKWNESTSQNLGLTRILEFL